MRYEWECPSGHRFERSFSMADKPSSTPCECGEDAVSLLSMPFATIIKNQPFDFAKHRATNYPNMAQSIGRSDEQQHAIYRRMYEERKHEVEALRRGHSKQPDSQYLGFMPVEMEGSICEAEGDKEAVVKDPEHWLKKTGMWMGD